MLRLTKFGLIASECIKEVPSGSLLVNRGENGITTIQYPNNTFLDVKPCLSHYKASLRKSRLDIGLDIGPPLWNDWPQHWWFGYNYADFTNPRLPINESIFSMNATWFVPPLPLNRNANINDPWYQSEPTESWWIGLQGPTVLQPVLELNGLMQKTYDAVSWNCCPSGMAWYSFPLFAQPGDVITGSINRIDGNKFDINLTGLYVYETITAVTSTSRGFHETRLVSAMSLDEETWIPNWAEIIQESYFITNCSQLPCFNSSFFNINIQIAERGLPFNETNPHSVILPWSNAYEIENGKAPINAVCNGTAQNESIYFNCSASH